MSAAELELIFSGRVDHPDLARARAGVERLVDVIGTPGATVDDAVRVVERMSGAEVRNVAAILALGLVGLRETAEDAQAELDDLTAAQRAADELEAQGVALPAHLRRPR